MSSDPIVREFDAALHKAERALIERAKEFGHAVVAPAAEHWEHDRQVPTAALRAACDAGLSGVELPKLWGGHGFRFSTKMRIVEELAKFDFGFAFSLVNHHNALVRLASAAPNLAARLVPRLLAGDIFGCSAYTEPGHGSDLAALETSAQRIDAGWELSGTKAWITNAAVAGVFVTLAQTEPGSRGKGVASFVVEADRPGFHREAAYELQGGYSIGTGGFRLDRYRASDEALLEAPGSGLQSALERINGARCYVAAMCAGMLESAIAQAVRSASQRRAFGRHTIEFQGLRWSLVDAHTDLAALRLLAYRAARAIDAGAPAEEEAARAKKFAGQRTLGHIANCVQAMGAEGLRGEHVLMRHLMAAKIACFADGTTEMMNERLGKIVAA
ncbi:MAG TPA: acyl-CoA dehydrogenase family protein, partial [Pirellulales bacterium]|nr:acyl-CoA dehydrogenase family protein [Pirellulales bacterium]